MKTLALLLFLCSPAFAEKVNVKVVEHTVGGTEYTQPLPDVSLGNGSESADSYSTSSVYVPPPHSVQNSLTDILMTLLLPDGRRVLVGCEDHLSGLTKANRHNCKNPTADELEANFSGDKVKLSWVAGFGGKKKDSETFMIVKVLPSPTKP
jgi:hypothetical protein